MKNDKPETLVPLETQLKLAQAAERKLLLLQRYMNSSPERITQFYARHHPHGPEGEDTDEDGDQLRESQLWDLGGPSQSGIIVYVSAEATRETVVRLLRKTADRIDRPPEGVLESSRREPDTRLPSQQGFKDENDIPF
jgi:hypothetical protein